MQEIDIAKTVREAIDKYIQTTAEDGKRAHLGASLIGRKCNREIWFMWRWARTEKFSSRMLRLFNRGHLEEFRFKEWLDGICETFWPLDPRTGEQIRVSGFKGYFGGSLDGIARNPAGIKGDFLTEFKTHNEKSFKKLAVGGVRSSKPEHYDQMQVYLSYHPRLAGALYFAICKNDDDIYVEFVERDAERAIELSDKVEQILLAQEPPAAMAEASQYNFYCKSFCGFAGLCYEKQAPDITCRSCRFMKTMDAGWTCTQDNAIKTRDEQVAACARYERAF